VKNWAKPFAWIAIIFLGAVVYSDTFHCSFHFDDQVYITNNFVITRFHHLLHYWRFYPCRFLTFLTLALNYHFNGLDVFGYHVFNLAIHLISALLVWWLCLLTLATPAMKKDKITPHAELVAGLAALVFVSHPLQTEAVTYIWQRAASMAAMFYLASLCFYIRSRQLSYVIPAKAGILNEQSTFYVCSFIFAILAMFTKENTVTLPLMVLLYEFCFFRYRKNIEGRYLFPFLLTIFIIPLTILFTKAQQFQAIQRFVHETGGISPWQYLLTQFRVIVTYIRLLVLPVNQNIDHDFQLSKSLFEWPVLASFLFLAGVLYGAKRLFAKYRLLSFSILWFFLTLCVESSIFPLKNLIFEHRLYLPMVGYSLFLVSGTYYLLGEKNIKIMAIILMMIIAVNSILTYQRNKVWKDELSLWDDAVKKSPHKARAVTDRGFAYFNQGNFTQALSDYDKAIELDPGLADAYLDRGLTYSQQGNYSQAIADYNRAIAINPNYADAYNNRGIFYIHQGDLDQAVSDLTKAIEIDPHNVKAYYNRGLGLAKEGNTAQAIADYKKAIELNPDNADAYYNLGLCYAQEKLFDEAMADFNKTIEIDPDYADAYNNRGIIYAMRGDYLKAMVEFDHAIKINPNDQEAKANKSHCYVFLRIYKK